MGDTFNYAQYLDDHWKDFWGVKVTPETAPFIIHSVLVDDSQTNDKIEKYKIKHR